MCVTFSSTPLYGCETYSSVLFAYGYLGASVRDDTFLWGRSLLERERNGNM